ncbi:MAG: AraC family transcriptional regulator [Hungatella sp.]|nr:AraC family transcriptional regulator [Hungatella sp.]
MNQDLLKRLSVITEEEQEFLSGRREIDRTRYTEQSQLIIDSKKMLDQGKLIQIRPHTRFVHFPRHRHNYVEVIYMCQGQTTHIIDGNQVVLEEGELLFLNQNAVQEILPAGREDIAVNLIILPEFFDTTFRMMGEEEHILRDFLVDCLRRDSSHGRFLHFKVADILPIQNLAENMVWTLMNSQPSKRSVNQFTMGLLLLQLTHYTDRLSAASQDFDQQLILQTLRYIDEHYPTARLTELASLMGYDIPWLSRMIKQLLGRTYKELLQVKRLNQAAFLLQSTRLPITDICGAIGYDNTSYFHRIFRAYYGMSPKEYRQNSDTHPATPGESE